MTWIIEERISLTLILGVFAVLFLVGFNKTRESKYAIGSGITLALIGLVWLLNLFVDTDQKRIVRAIEAMGASVKARDAAGIIKHVSNEFRLGNARRILFPCNHCMPK